MAVSLAATRTPAAVRVANEGHALDLRAIEDACAYLRLRSPVVITFTNGRGGRGKLGMHMGSRHADGSHDVRVTRGQSNEQASRTLWHELEHARQDETFPNFSALYTRDAWTYERAAEAREQEHERWPLVR